MIRRKYEKVTCTNCGKFFSAKDILVGQNPFKKEMTIYGCPNCKEIETFVTACDFVGCSEEHFMYYSHGNFRLGVCTEHYHFVKSREFYGRNK